MDETRVQMGARMGVAHKLRLRGVLIVRGVLGALRGVLGARLIELQALGYDSVTHSLDMNRPRAQVTPVCSWWRLHENPPCTFTFGIFDGGAGGRVKIAEEL